MFCLILILIVALRAIAPKLVSTTPVLKKYFYNPVDAVFDLFSTIVNLFFRMMKFFAEAVIKGVSDTIRGLTQFVVETCFASSLCRFLSTGSVQRFWACLRRQSSPLRLWHYFSSEGTSGRQKRRSPPSGSCDPLTILWAVSQAANATLRIVDRRKISAK